MAILLAVIITIPILIQSIHEYQHHDEEHCLEKNEQHFHVAEHHCSICDYTFCSIIVPELPHYIINETQYCLKEVSRIYIEHVSIDLLHFSLRAPPF